MIITNVKAIDYVYATSIGELTSIINNFLDKDYTILEMEPMNGVYGEEIIRVIFTHPYDEIDEKHTTNGYYLCINRYNLESCYNDSRPNDVKSKKRFLQRLKAGKVEGCTWEKYVEYCNKRGLEVIEPE